MSLSKEINETKFLLVALCSTAAVNVKFTMLVALTFSVLSVIQEMLNTLFMSSSNYYVLMLTNSLVIPLFSIIIYFFVVRDLYKRSAPELQTTLADIRVRNYLFKMFKLYAIVLLSFLVILIPFLAFAFALESFKDSIPTSVAMVLIVIIVVVLVCVSLVLLYALGICSVNLALFRRYGILNLYAQAFRQSAKRFLRLALVSVVMFVPYALYVSLDPSGLTPSFQELNVSRLGFLAIYGGFTGAFTLYWFYLDNKTFLIAEK